MKRLRTVLAAVATTLAFPFFAAQLPHGRVIGWGMNISGEATGVPSTDSSTGLVMIAERPLTNVVAVAAGEFHSLALANAGRVIGWGWNKAGQATGIPRSEAQNSPGPVTIGGLALSDVVAVSAGEQFSLALLGNGTVVGWGTNMYQAEKVPKGLTNITAISAGWTHSLALKSDGTVVGWGIPEVPGGLSNIVAIAAGRDTYANNLVLKADGTVVQWTAAGTVEPGPAGLSNLVAVASGAGHCLGLTRTGAVLGWGANNWGQAVGYTTTSNRIAQVALPVKIAGKTLTNAVAVAAGAEFSIALKSDGTVVTWGYIFRRPATVPAGMTNVTAIAAGQNFCLAVQTDKPAPSGKKRGTH